MKIKMIFLNIVVAGLFTIFQSCSKDDEIRGEIFPLHLSQSKLYFDANGDSAVVQILDNAKDWEHPGAWGVDYVDIETCSDSLHIQNGFEIESNGKGDTYNVYISPFVREIFSIEKRGRKIHIQVNENTGPERKLKIEINAGPYGRAGITVFQKGQ